MSFGWKAWSAGLAASAAVHAALAFNFAAPEVADTGAAGPPATISGSLASVLGGVSQPRPVRPGIVPPTAPAKTEQVAPRVAKAAPARARPVEPVRAVGPVRAVPVRPAPAVTASAAPVLPEVATPATPATAPPLQPAEEPDEGGGVALPVKRPARPASSERPAKQAAEARARDKPTPPEASRRTVPDQSQRRRTKKRERKRQNRATSQAGSDRAGAAGAMRGGGARASGASAGAVRSYGARVRARILANRPSAGGSGRAVVTFGLSAAGRLSYARLARSSGNATLDGAALAAVRRSSPFPSPPAGATASQLRFSISFDFR